MSDHTFSEQDYANAAAIGRAEGLQEGRAEGLRQAAIEGAGFEQGRAAGYAEGFQKAASTYRERVRAILESPEAQGREVAAQHLAFETEMTPSAAVAALAGIARGASIGARAASVAFTPDVSTLK